MTSKEIIEQRIQNPEFIPCDYSIADWIVNFLKDNEWEQISDIPHYRFLKHNIRITISPYVNLITVNTYNIYTKEYVEKYFHESIPKNDQEMNEFFEKIKHLF